MGLIVCPSRELARQTFEVINGYTGALREDGHPELRSLLVMGGVDMKTQARTHACPHTTLGRVGHVAMWITPPVMGGLDTRTRARIRASCDATLGHLSHAGVSVRPWSMVHVICSGGLVHTPGDD